MVATARSTIVSFVRGESSFDSLRSAGIEYSSDDLGRVEVQSASQDQIVIDLEDVAAGLVALSPKFQDLREWARFLLSSSNVVQLDDKFESTEEGDLLLNAIWDAAFGSRPNRSALDCAVRVLQGSSQLGQ